MSGEVTRDERLSQENQEPGRRDKEQCGVVARQTLTDMQSLSAVGTSRSAVEPATNTINRYSH